MEPQLSGIPETMLIPLWAKAAETGRPRPIIRDPMAVEMISRIDYDFARFEKSSLTQVGVSIRTLLLDRAVGNFLTRNPGAVVVNLGAGLDTRQDRLSRNGFRASRWYDLDVPQAVDLRRMFFEENQDRRFIAKSMFDFSWMEQVREGDNPVLLVAEGLLMYFREKELKPLFERLMERFPAGGDAPGDPGPVPGGQGQAATIPWARWRMCPSSGGESKTPATWSPCSPAWEYVEDWNYFDFHKKRWKGFGLAARLPLIKPLLSNRIVHLRFRGQV